VRDSIEGDGRTQDRQQIGPHDCRLIADALDVLGRANMAPARPGSPQTRIDRLRRIAELRNSFRALAERGR
jgi:hypothetical protein